VVKYKASARLVAGQAHADPSRLQICDQSNPQAM